MTTIGTLWTVPVQTSGRRIKAAAALGGLKLKEPEGYKHYEDNKKPEFLEKFASGKIPAFLGEDGFCLFEGAAIARYVAGLAPNAGLLGEGLKESALVDQWVHYLESEIAEPMRPLLRMISGSAPYNKQNDTTGRENLLRPLGVLEKHLSTRTYFVGERITLADLTAASVLVVAYENLVDKKLRTAHPHTLRHYETIRNHPLLKEIWGPTEYCETAKQYTPPAKAPKEEKPKAPAAPKEKAPKPKKEKEDDDDDEPLVPEEPKKKNPLDDLPKSTFNLEDWKRAYSNMDTRGADGSLKWFYDHFDPEGFSVWRVDFKYPGELTKVFMSSNQITGFFNRLEGSRKYLFGSMGVLGEDNNSILSGVLILRGQDHKAVVDCAPDWESYTFAKLDYAGADKDYFEAALAWDLEIDGKKWKDGKNFK